jgi:hypothetical protein
MRVTNEECGSFIACRRVAPVGRGFHYLPDDLLAHSLDVECKRH